MTTTTYEPGEPERDDLPSEAPDIEVLSTETPGGATTPGAATTDAADVDPTDPATEPPD